MISLSDTVEEADSYISQYGCKTVGERLALVKELFGVGKMYAVKIGENGKVVAATNVSTESEYMSLLSTCILQRYNSIE